MQESKQGYYDALHFWRGAYENDGVFHLLRHERFYVIQYGGHYLFGAPSEKGSDIKVITVQELRDKLRE